MSNSMELPRPLEGIIPPIVTPLLGVDELDAAGAERLVEHVLAGGVHGLFVLGTTGEAPSLSHDLRKQFVAQVCRQVANRVPILVGITDTSFAESVSMAQAAADAGAQALVLAPPYYFMADQPELLEYVTHLVSRLPLPLFIYNMPALTKSVFQPNTVAKLAELEQVVGIKDSSANMIYYHQLRRVFRQREDFTILVGPDELMAESVLLGGHGGVNGGANMFPTLYVELFNAARTRDIARVAQLHEIVIDIASTIYRVGHHGSSLIKGIKTALSLMGICSDFVAEPFHRFRSAERNQVARLLDEIREKLRACGIAQP
ncbi:MAG: dihydrodipicolinate synthase family protein [Sedimentisphaerales bacterium]|nr:dihydrodipicolinate synthase family protein [Sedimentisphaerales bacterium]